MRTTKVIITNLGPGNFYHYGLNKYKDGDAVELPIDNALSIINSKLAVAYSEEEFNKIQNLLKTASNKRIEIEAKVQALNEGGNE